RSHSARAARDRRRGDRMKRREVIALLGGAATSSLCWPLAARSQESAKLPVIGFIGVGSAAGAAHVVDGLHRGLRELGFVEGQNVAIEYRWAGRRYERIPGLAAALVRR